MRSSEKIYEEVAERCSSYVPDDCNCSTRNDMKEKVSCTTCKHFVDGAYCDIDLYDQIVMSHKLDQ